MKINPRLDLFTFEIRSRDKTFKTFYDFVLTEIDGTSPIEDSTKTFLSFIMKNLDSENARNNRAKKMICLVEKQDKNKHLDKKPSFDAANDIISGVINGGPFGRDGILMNINDKDDSEPLDKDKTVLSYYYIFLYLPKDYNIGLAMIHSNGMEENLTGVFKEFIRKTFKTERYFSADVNDYCPKKFQDSFKNNSSIQKLTFKQSFVEANHSQDPISNLLREYDIQIVASPKNKRVSAKNASKFLSILQSKVFKINDKSSKALEDFSNTEVTLKDTTTKTQRTFEWNTRDHDFSPVIYLEDHVEKLNSDGTPDFTSLKQFCLKLFKEDIFQEIRPDQDVKRII